MASTIPAPRGVPFIGSALQVPSDEPQRFFNDLAERFPEGLYQVELVGRRVVVVYDPDLVAEVCDESRFYKSIDPPLTYIRDFTGDGLFSAHENEEVWGQAHRILLPAFSQRSMRAYFPHMLEVTQDLVRHWADGGTVDVTDDMTRLTLDTIALAGFGQRFRSIGKPELHPFLLATRRVMVEAMARTRQLPWVTRLKRHADTTYRTDIATMRQVADDVIRARRAGSEKGRDLLGLMMNASDPVTGHRLSDENIRNQVLTFLIAGHETTSGTLAFALYHLLRNPHVLARAYAEVDRVLPGDTVPTYDQIMKLDLIPRILEETLRLQCPVSAIGLKARRATTLGGRYEIPDGQIVSIMMRPLHTHPRAWTDPLTFDPDRWLPARRATLHPHAYKPFGNGARACIGRQFAMTGGRLALAMILQHIALSDPDAYQLRERQTLTVRAEHFRIRVAPRGHRPEPTASAPETTGAEEATTGAAYAAGTPMTVAFGSNLGSSEELAQRIAVRARRCGFAVQVRTLNQVADEIPTEGLLVVVTSSYNGAPPDNADRFDEVEIPAGSLAGLRFALLGNGDRQWPTYQAFPKRVTAALSGAGASALTTPGEIDAGRDPEGMAAAWLAEFWTAIEAQFGARDDEATLTPYDVEVVGDDRLRPGVVPPDAYPITVEANEELVTDGTGERNGTGVRALSVRLPAGVQYEPGDHLAVYARNDPGLVAWALRILRVPPDQAVLLARRNGYPETLPTGVPISAEALLSGFLELQDPATREHLAALARHTECPWTAKQLAAWTADTAESRQAYADEVLAKRLSVLSVLARFPAIELPLGVFLGCCRTIRPRFYSISSAPVTDPSAVTLTVGLSGSRALDDAGRFRGMCSWYLAGLRPGDRFFGHVRVATPPFRLPPDPGTPLILIGAGTGFAPLRGFLQHREQAAKGGPVKVFFGCRHPEYDWLYGEEMRRWAADDVAELHLAFSRLDNHPHRYVQHALAADGDAVWQLLGQGAHVYVCGDGTRMAPAVRETLTALHQRVTGETSQQSAAWLAGLRAAGRYQEDIFA